MTPSKPAVTDSLVVAVWDTETANNPADVEWNPHLCTFGLGIIRWYRFIRDGRLCEIVAMGEHLAIEPRSMAHILLHGPHQLHAAFNGWRWDVPLLAAASVAGEGPATRDAVVDALRLHLFDPAKAIGETVGHPHPIRLDFVREAHGLPKWGPGGQPLDHAEIPAMITRGDFWTPATACRDDVQALARAIKIGVQAGFLGLNRLHETLGGEPAGFAAAFRSPHVRHPESPDETDRGGVFKYHVPTDRWWPAMKELAVATPPETPASSS